jgi:hypothetical protein
MVRTVAVAVAVAVAVVAWCVCRARRSCTCEHNGARSAARHHHHHHPPPPPPPPSAVAARWRGGEGGVKRAVRGDRAWRWCRRSGARRGGVSPKGFLLIARAHADHSHTHTHSSHTREKQLFFFCRHCIDLRARTAHNRRRNDETTSVAPRRSKSAPRGEGGGASAPERRTVTPSPEHTTPTATRISRSSAQCRKARAPRRRARVASSCAASSGVASRRRRARSIGASRIATPFSKPSPAPIRTAPHRHKRHGTAPQTPAHQRHPRTRPSPSVRHTRCAPLHCTSQRTHARTHAPPLPTSRICTPNGTPRHVATTAPARTSRVAARDIHLCAQEPSRVR